MTLRRASTYPLKGASQSSGVSLLEGDEVAGELQQGEVFPGFFDQQMSTARLRFSQERHRSVRAVRTTVLRAR